MIDNMVTIPFNYPITDLSLKKTLDLVKTHHTSACKQLWDCTRPHLKMDEDDLQEKRDMQITLAALELLCSAIYAHRVKVMRAKREALLPPPGNGRAAPDTSADNPDGPTAGGLTAPVAAPVADL